MDSESTNKTSKPRALLIILSQTLAVYDVI